MAALTADEREASQAVFEQYNPDQDEGQTVAPWTQMTPLQVVRSAFNLIRYNLSADHVGREFDDYLRLQESEVRFYYNEPVTQNHPLADGDMIRFGQGTQDDQDKLDREIYNIVVGAEPEPVGVEPEIDVGRSELGEDIFAKDDFVQGQRIIRIGGDNRFIFDREGLERTWRTTKIRMNPLAGAVPLPAGTQIEYGVLNILADGGRRRRRKTKKSKRQRQRGGIPPPGGEPRLTIAIPRPQVPGPRAESGAQAPRPRGGRKTRRSRK